MNVVSVGKPSPGSHISYHIGGHTQERNPMDALNVGGPLVKSQISSIIKGFIQERNLLNAENVEKPSAGSHSLSHITGPTQEQNSDLSECSPYGWFYNAPSLQRSYGTGHSGLKRKTNIEDLPPCACGSRPSMIQGFWGRGQWGLPFSDHGDKPRGTWAGGSQRGRFQL